MQATARRLVMIGVGLVAGALALPAGSLEAQGRSRDVEIPKEYLPPRGMCRIWIAGVPAGQQPAPTDCATAIRKRPSNASVIFGEPTRTIRENGMVREQFDVPETGRGRGGVPVESRVPERRTDPIEPRTRETPSPRSTPVAPRTRETPAPTPSPRTSPPPSSGEGRSRTRPSPPPGYEEDLLARARWLDEELLASLYGEAPPGYGYAATPADVDQGRADPRQMAGQRGLGRSNDLVPWAIDAYGRQMTANDVELRVRGELELLGAPYGYAGVGYGGYGQFDESVLVPRPGECVDRNFDGRCDDLLADTDGCADRNGDGRCDDARYDRPVVPEACPPGVRCDPYRIRRSREQAAGTGGSAGGNPYLPDDRLDGRNYSAGYCFDRNRDGRCDEPWTTGNRIPQTLPEMASAVGLQRGIASYDVERWVGRNDAQPRVTDRNGDGIPDRVTWLDPSGQIVQIWTDRNGDGIADRVELFRNGLPVQVISR